MEAKDLSTLSDEELLVEKKKLKESKMIHATLIGILAGILIFGTVAWAMSPERKLGFIIPMIIPITLIYRMIKNGKKNSTLEEILKERNLN